MNGDMTASMHSLLLSSLFAVADNRHTEEDILFMLLNDTKVRVYLHKKGEVTLDVHSKEFGFTKFEELKAYFGEQMFQFTEELEEEIRIVLDHKKLLIAGKGKIISKRVTVLIFLELLKKVINSSPLMKKDFEVVTNAGLLRTNFCRWVLVYRFLRYRDQFRVLQRFETWLKEWKDPNLLISPTVNGN